MTQPTTDIERFAEIEKLLRSGQARGPVDGFYRPVDDRELITRALRLANMRTWEDFGYVYAEFGLGHGTTEYSAESGASQNIARNFGDEKIGPAWQDLHAEDLAEYRREQKSFVEVLKAISKNASAARSKYEPLLAENLKGVLCVGFATFQAGKLNDKARPYLRGVRQAWIYVAALLLDPERPERDPKRSFGDRLRQCALGEDEGSERQCGKWFLSYAGEGGGRMKKYCSDECTGIAALQTSAARQGKHRSKKKAARGK